MNLSNELTQQVNNHLDEVRKYLGNLPADERQEILQSIESHIYDALQSRSSGEPTSALLDAVTAEMDPPESYGELPVVPKKKKFALYAFIFILFAGFSLFFIPLAFQGNVPGNQTSRKASIQIVEGVGWNDIRLGMPQQLLLEKLGFPDVTQGSRMEWRRQHIVCLIRDGRLATVKFDQGFKGATTAGIQIGSSEKDTILAYGKPTHRDQKINHKGAYTVLGWKETGITTILTDEDGVVEITIYDPFTKIRRQNPTPDEIIGHWRTVDIVPNVENFHPNQSVSPSNFPITKLAFFPNGQTDKPWGTWTNHFFTNSENTTKSVLWIKKYNGDAYLFLPWVSDTGSSLSHLVLKKQSQNPLSKVARYVPRRTKREQLFRNSIPGRWISIDFVSSIEKFGPKTKASNRDLYLKELTFLPDGKTDRSFWTWENNTLHHSGDNTDAKLLIKEIDGENYLLVEWMSGDVIHRGLPPKYYVLKKPEP